LPLIAAGARSWPESEPPRLRKDPLGSKHNVLYTF
jgi:hypothetical protein